MAWVQVNLNTFLIFEWDRRYCALDESENPTIEGLLKFLCPVGTPSDMAAFKNRYLEVSEKDRDLLVYPDEPYLKENVFGPLRQAKTSYVLGNYAGSITLCGIVAEKVALLIHASRLSPSRASQKTFERLGQSGRVEKLLQAGHIDKQQKKDFDDIKKSRDAILHRWNTPEATAAKRAARAYASATRIVLRLMDIRYSNGAITLDSKLTEYLTAQGEIVFEQDDE